MHMCLDCVISPGNIGLHYNPKKLKQKVFQRIMVVLDIKNNILKI